MIKKFKKWFKKKACDWDIHSFKIKVIDNGFDLPKFYCLWCGNDIGDVFGKPPTAFIQAQQKMQQARKEAWEKIMPKQFTAYITRISEQKYSRTENVYYRIGMRLDTGEFAFTDVVPTYRNFGWWKPIIDAGKGTKIGHLFLKEGYTKPLKVDADSEPIIIQETLVKEDPRPTDEALYLVRIGDPEIWSISATKGNKRHEVTILHGFAQCDCEGFRFAGKHKECKHTKAVIAHKKGLEAQKINQGTLL